MADKLRTAATSCWHQVPGLPTLLVALLFVLSPTHRSGAQSPTASSYPVDPAAAAGMSSAPTGNITYQEAEMMHIRSAAYDAQGEAVAASLARSADASIEDAQLDRTLQKAREEKEIKRAMANRLKWERTAAANNKISANDMSSWRTESGNVRVERNVPDAFITSLIAEEEQAAARRAAEGRDDEGGPIITAPIRATKKALGWLPFAGGGSEPDDSAYNPSYVTTSSTLPESGDGGSGGGFLSNLRPPRLPFVGGGSDEAPVEVGSTSTSGSSEPVFSSRSGGSAPPSESVQASVTKPGTVPRISGAALVDGRSPVGHGTTAPTNADYTPRPSSDVPASDSLPGEEKKGSGLFAMLKSDGGSSGDSGGGLFSSGDGGGGLFSFGKKKSSAGGAPGIDASLFPSDMVNEAPRGGSLGGGYTAEDVAAEAGEEPSSTGFVELPGGTQTRERSRGGGGGLSLPKPNLSLPDIPVISKPDGGSRGGSVPTMTTINSAGTDYYTVNSTAQFMVYGENQMQSEVRALPAGTLVRMTKPGENWASIRLSDGTEGVVQNKFLSPSSGGGGGGEFAPSGN